MAISTRTVQNNVLKALGLDSTDTVLLARALRWLQKSIDKLQGSMPSSEIFQKSEMSMDTVDGQATYALPADFIQMISLRDDDNSTIIVPVERPQFDREHPKPSDESEGKPDEYTLEYDQGNRRHIFRLAPIPDDEYTLYAVMKVWHPKLSSSQGLTYDKIETAVEDGGTYQGSLEIYPDQEYATYRAELKENWRDSLIAAKNIFAMQKPKAARIRTFLRKNQYQHHGRYSDR